MAQPNERVFYDADGIFISQYRFVTPDGSAYPTRTIQRVWGSVDKRPASCLFKAFAIFLGFVGLAVLMPAGLVINAAATSNEGPGTAVGGSVIVLGLAIFVGVIVWYAVARSAARRRYWANFTFAGGGTFTGSSTSSISYPSPYFGGQVRTRSRSERQPDYATWSYDEDWTRNLIAAANEALVAAQV